MPELRQNRLTKEWVIIATERAKRPEEMQVKRPEGARQLQRYAQNCPFCPGNESLAPPEVLRISGPKGDWRVRVVPNKFGALAREGQPKRTILRSLRTVNGVGIHDVIVETPDHSLTLALLSDDQIGAVLDAYRVRYNAISQDGRIAHITIFKNHGAGAGASLEHPHSQMLATPVISNQVRGRMYEALRHHDEFGECIFCQLVADEMNEQTRIVATTEHFIALEPFASATPFSTHIFPRRHMASFGDISDEELADLARVLRNLLLRLYVGLDNPDYNFTIRTAPAENAGVLYYHWYLSIIPRLTRVAGFELGSGMFINTVLPEAAAEFLRKVDVSKLPTPA